MATEPHAGYLRPYTLPFSPQSLSRVFVDHDGKGDRTHLQEFSKEARLLAQFAHPNIVRILDFEEGDLPFLVLEFVRGFTAKQLLDQSGQLAPLQSVQTARDAAQALAYAHNRGLVHRDVKPDNLMVDMEWKPETR